jgi:hypothetical protein
MTYLQCFPPESFNDGDELDGCNLSGRTVDFQHKAVTVRDSNCFDMTPVNAENVTVEDSPSWGKASTPSDDSDVPTPDDIFQRRVNSAAQEVYGDDQDMIDTVTQAVQDNVVAAIQSTRMMRAQPIGGAQKVCG